MALSPPLQQVDRTYVLRGRRRLIYFGGCDYFRLSSHPAVVRALTEGLKRFGLNVAASRSTTGNHELFGQLESAIASFFAADSAALVASGYATNLVVAQTLAGRFARALVDERSHGSVVDALPFLDCPVTKFRHRDPADAARHAKRYRSGGKLLLLTDGMFSHDGSAAPLRDYLQVLPHDALLLADDAHGAGVLGREGRGTLEQAGVSRQRIVQTISLSKAFGVYGGAVLGSKQLRQEIIERSRIFNGNTPLPLPLANAAIAAVALLGRDRSLRKRLRENAAYAKAALGAAGLELPEAPGPIISILPRDAAHARRLTGRLLARGVFPSLIRYAGGPANGYFRFMISSEHSRAQLDALVAALGPAERRA